MLLEIEDLKVVFSGDGAPVTALKGVSLDIDRGETVALVGESGSGKSVTALAVMGLLAANARVSGSVRLDGEELTAMNEEGLRRLRGDRMAMVFQEPMTSLNPVYTVGSQISEPMLIHSGLDRATARDMAIELMAKVGIADPARRFDSYPHQLSGGQRQRAMIAMALACRPDLLIADEPTTALDVTVEAQIMKLIRELQEEFDMAVLLITHDLGLAAKNAKRINVMTGGAIVEHGPTERVFSAPAHPYTKKLLASIPERRDQEKEIGETVLEARNISCHFPIKKGLFGRRRGVFKAVDRVSLTLSRGETLGIVGESGSGKTTLAMAILRLTRFRGQVVLRGEDLATLPRRRLVRARRHLQIVFQDPYSSLSPRMTVGAIVGEGLKVHRIGRNRREREKLVARALERVGLSPDMAARFPHEFSGGQRQRIAVARALVLEPEVLILDEPTSALDMTIQAQIIELLRDLQDDMGLAYIFISHDLRTVRALADRVMVMRHGMVVEHGGPEVFSAPKHTYTRELFAAAFS